MSQKIYSIIAAFFLTYSLYSQVVINEFSAANLNGVVDNFGDTEDWVELYNLGATTVDLEGYFLSDNIDNLSKWAFPAGVSIAPGEHLLIYCSDRDLVMGGFIHAGFKLTQTKQEYVAFSDPAQNIIDAIQLTPTQMDHSRGRAVDGDPSFGLFLNPTPGGPNSNAVGEYAVKPEFNVAPGFYNGSISVGITAEPNVEIRYTTDGSEPTANSTLYSNPIQVTQTTVIKAKVYSTDAPPSFVEANTYFIDVDHTVPVISIAGSDLESLLNGNQFDPIGSFELFGENKELLDEAYGEYNKHGNDSWAYDQRGIDYITRDQMGYTSSIDYPIFPLKDRNRYQRLIIKAAANDNYPFEDGAHIRDSYVHTLSQLADMQLDERTWEPCVLYLNGEYWGVYDIREKVDDPDYTRNYYDQGLKWIDYIKTWGATWEEYGSITDWNSLHTFITTNDMSIDANYEQAAEELDMQSLVDYMIINTHVVCKDWLNWNTAWWRGRNPDGEAQKWRYTLWDMDATFGHYINYTNIPNDDPTADPCDNEELGPNSDPEGHVDLIISLLENEEFHSLYVNRYADLNNTFFTCDFMIDLLDEMIGRIEPEMPDQIQRWGGTMQGWQDEVQELKDFILTRCTVLNSGIEDCYDVTGPYPVTVKIEPDDSPNNVRVNTFIPTAYPFNGDYFAGTTLSFEAVPDFDWELDHWEVDTNSFSPDQFASLIKINLDSLGEVVTAYFRPLVPCADPINIDFEIDYSTINALWEGPSNSLSYEVNWRPTGSTDDWNIVSTTEENHQIFGLEICSEYDVRVRSICEHALGEYLEFTIKTQCLSGTEEAVAGMIDLNVFPNPFSDDLTIDVILAENSDVRIELLTTTGQIVNQANYSKLNAGQHFLPMENVQDLSSGVYLVRVLTNEGMLVERLVKN